MAELEILTIEAKSPKSHDPRLLEILYAIGIEEREIRNIQEDVLEVLGKLAFSAFKSSVPVRNFELRQNLRLRSKNRVSKTVSVLPTTRTTSNTRTQISNDELADILEEGRHRSKKFASYAAYRRSRRSFAEAPFDPQARKSPTKDWAYDTVERFDAYITSDPEVTT